MIKGLIRVGVLKIAFEVIQFFFIIFIIPYFEILVKSRYVSM